MKHNFLFQKSKIFLDLGMIFFSQSSLGIFLKVYEIEPRSQTNTTEKYDLDMIINILLPASLLYSLLCKVVLTGVQQFKGLKIFLK